MQIFIRLVLFWNSVCSLPCPQATISPWWSLPFFPWREGSDSLLVVSLLCKWVVLPNSFSSWDEIKHRRCLLKKALEGTKISALFSVYRITSSAYVPRLLVFRDYGARDRELCTHCKISMSHTSYHKPVRCWCTLRGKYQSRACFYLFWNKDEISLDHSF